MVKTYENGKWFYGDAWEKFPIKSNEIWTAGNNILICADIIKDDIDFFLKNQAIDMTYIDPPWNLSNINAFYTKANKQERFNFKIFIDRLINIVKNNSKKVNYMEMGFQNLEYVKSIIKENKGTITNIWDITYYKKKPCHLIRYNFEDNDVPIEVDFNGLDDLFTPDLAIKSEKPNTILDLCTGRGLTGRTAFNNNVNFIGTELNERRIANLIEFYAKNKLIINKDN